MRIGMMVDMYKPHVSAITTCVALNKRRRMAEQARASAARYDIHRTVETVLADYERLAAERVRRERGWPAVRRWLRRAFPFN